MKVEQAIYVKIILMTISIMIAGIVLVYIPSFFFDFSMDYMNRKASMILWLFFAYVIFAFAAYLIEKYYVDSYSNRLQYKDVSLEFSNLDSSLKKESEILARLSKITGGHIKEISLVYNLPKYFKLKSKLHKLLHSNPEDIDPLKIKIKMDKIQQFQQNMHKDPGAFFTGKGFITFENYKYAELFKRMYDQAYSKRLFPSLKPKFTTSVRGKFNNTVSKVIAMNKKKLDLETSKEPSNTISQSDLAQKDSLKKLGSLQSRYNIDTSVFSHAWKRLFSNNFTAEQEKNISQMKAIFGKNFKIKRTLDPELINFNYSVKTELSRFNKMAYSVLLLFVLPLTAYILHYFVAKYQLIDLNQSDFPLYHTILKYTGVILVALLDQIGYFLIEHFFYNQRFMKASQMFSYSLSYYSFFNLLVIIIAPNFAIKQAFIDLKPYIAGFDSKLVASKYLSVITTNYFKLVFSALNYKLIKPLLINRFILHKNKRIQTNSSIIFGISFVITSVFFVAFFGSITPSVFILFVIALAALYYYDRKIFTKERLLAARSEKLSEVEKGDFHTGLPIMKRYDLSKIPITIFSTALNILVIGTFLVSYFGYYGIAIDMEFSATQNLSLFDKIRTFFSSKSKSDSKGRLFYSFMDQIFSLRFLKNAPEPKMNRHSFDIFYQIFEEVLSDYTFLIVIFAYVFYVCVFILLNNNQTFISRIEKRIWKKQKNVDNIVFQGKGYRELNPAYELLDQQPEHTE